LEAILLGTENFDKLPHEKRQNVINAALACFGSDGYKKTAISEIAERAGIAKASIFQYFGTKMELYKFLCAYSCEAILEKMKEGPEDFFECLRMATDIKLSVMEKHPHMYDFLLSVAQETDAELAGCVKEMGNGDFERGMAILFANVDWGRFKPEYDRKTVMSLLGWISEGCARQNAQAMTGREIAAEVGKYMAIMKKVLYREECL
jgi:AcrR family transcriptional regulator